MVVLDCCLVDRLYLRGIGVGVVADLVRCRVGVQDIACMSDNAIMAIPEHLRGTLQDEAKQLLSIRHGAQLIHAHYYQNMQFTSTVPRIDAFVFPNATIPLGRVIVQYEREHRSADSASIISSLVRCFRYSRHGQGYVNLPVLDDPSALYIGTNANPIFMLQEEEGLISIHPDVIEGTNVISNEAERELEADLCYAGPIGMVVLDRLISDSIDEAGGSEFVVPRIQPWLDKFERCLSGGSAYLTVITVDLSEFNLPFHEVQKLIMSGSSDPNVFVHIWEDDGGQWELNDREE